jgi:pantoate--beta-alanine ligase
MGALHAGHLKLLETCRSGCDLAAASIFVNPLQFGPAEDLSRYPRPFEKDRALCEQAGVDVLFAPEAGGFYAADHATYCEVQGFDRHLCGASRPGHFRGVCTVVLKLFQLIQPRRSYFGKKDIQQAFILKKMVADLSLDVEMILVDTVREPSGLALSSRNAYLTPEEKERAAALYRGLSRAGDTYRAGERNTATLKTQIRDEIQAAHPTRIEYIEAVSQAALEPLPRLEEPAVLAVAVYFGNTRLIDNLLLP